MFCKICYVNDLTAYIHFKNNISTITMISWIISMYITVLHSFKLTLY